MYIESAEYFHDRFEVTTIKKVLERKKKATQKEIS